MIQAVLIAIDVLAASLGAVVLWSHRFVRTKSEQSAPPAPTHLVTGLVLILVGYHCVVWAFPGVAAIQFPRDRWYIVLGAGVVLIVLSRLMDRL